MAVPERALPFRGDLQSLIGSGPALLFTTTHPEGRATALYRLDVDSSELKERALPGGGSALVADEGHVYVAGTDGHVHRGALDGPLSALGEKFSPPPRALALLSRDRLAALCGSQVVVIGRSDGAVSQRLSLGEEGTVLVSDPSGAWLVVGTTVGTVIVFDGETRAELMESERKKLHEGAVTALCFEPAELRVLSTGADVKLLSTHIRGRLEPEDRGGKAAHDAAVRAICFGPGERFYSGGRDGQIKVWEAGTSRRRPATVKDGVPPTVALAIVSVKGRPHLVIAGEDASLRLFALDAAGKVGDPVRTFTGAMSWARAESAANEPSRREAALRALAIWKDAPSVDMLLARAAEDGDHGLRVLAATLLGETGSPRARAGLERLLNARDEAVRRVALSGLRKLDGETALRPLELALAAKKADVGTLAVEALTALAARDDQALTRLTAALDEDPVEVRTGALAGLEKVLGAGPEADLLALRSKRADVRRLALIRCFQRDLLANGAVQSALRRHAEDPDADVRAMAFLVAVRSQPELTAALRHLDKDLHRQLHELETHGKAAAPDARLPATKAVDPKKLTDDVLAPLLQAMASRALDTCLRGASGLASLQDGRAFGSLLQLSRDSLASARVSACKALQALGDARANNRLRTLLRDSQAEVRDAAFTALSRLLEADGPLAAAEAGLGAEHEDVRRRGLEILVREIRKSGAAKANKAALDLLARTLDDAAPSVRTEAFKAALNLGVGGAGAGALRFTLRSMHADLRREVLVEVEAQIAEAWAAGLLLDLFADPDPSLRKAAFAFASKRAKTSDVKHLVAALAGRYPDLRIEAATALSKRHTAGARDLLVKSLDDEEIQVRRLAVDALVVDDATDALYAAMGSRFPDVVVKAATARAAAGDTRALGPLLALAAEPMPETGDRGPWLERTEAALGGLSALGDPAALAVVLPFIDHAEARLRKAAAVALGPCCRPGQVEPLRAALQHADREVKLQAAFGLALNGDPGGASILFAAPTAAAKPAQRNSKIPEPAQTSAGSVTPAVALLGAVGLGDAGRDQRLAYLDHSDRAVRDQALLLALMAEWLERDGQPDQCLAALSSATPRVRLLAARALEQFGDHEAFGAVVVDVFNDRGDGVTPWTVPAETVRRIAALVTGEDPQLRVEAARLLALRERPEQEHLDRAWRQLQRRIGDSAPPAAITRQGAESVSALVFGAYVGLARLKGSSAEIRIQQTALSRLLAMGARNPSLVGGVTPVLVQALGDPHQPVRKQAFDGLRSLGMSADRLGAEALASEHRDVGALGLQLLAEASGAGGDGVLTDVMMSRDDGLEEEALKLLSTRSEPISALGKALSARSSNLRDQAVAALARVVAEPAAASALRSALSSRYRALRFRAAEELATIRDPAAFPVLVELLAADGTNEHRRAVTARGRMGESRTPGALLDRIDADPAGTAAKDMLIAAAGNSRDLGITDRLFAHLIDPNTRATAGRALLMLSGHDQAVVNEDDAEAMRRAGDTWEARQHPRNDALLARLLTEAYGLGDARLVRELLPAARWAKTSIDEALAPLANFADDRARHEAIGALSWRLRLRNGPAAPLIKALEHADLSTRFLAAEGLARAGRKDGVVVLLASVDTLEDLGHRQRAVEALGKLADARALDSLLRIVATEGHALQEQAAEALGHLADTPKATEIFGLLKGLSAGDSSVSLQALTGLRYYGGASAWALIRARATDEDWTVRQRVAQLLGFNDDPHSRELLVKLIATDDDRDVVNAAFVSLRLLVGPDSLEPDYAVMRGQHNSPEPDTLTRLGERGDAARILDLLSEIDAGRASHVSVPLSQALLSRDPAPVEAALSRLDAPHDATGALAARIVGRASSADPKPLLATTGRIFARWSSAREDSQRGGPLAEQLPSLTERLGWLLWAAGRHGAGEAELIAAARLIGMDASTRAVRHGALAALADGFMGENTLNILASTVTGPDGADRALAASALSRKAPARAAALVVKVLDDPPTLAALHPDPRALSAGLSSTHTMGAVLPAIVRLGDVSDLLATLSDKNNAESVRLGAIEGLGQVGQETARAALIALGKDTEEDETLRKAAWRALRRAKRASTPVEARP